MVAGTELLEIGLMFAAVAISGAVAHRINQSVIPFYIIGGIALNQYVAGNAGLPYVREIEFIEIGAELGIVFLLFFLGLEFSVNRFLENKENIGKVGILDFAINFSVGLIIGLALGWTIFEAVLLAGIVYISSSAIITKSLIDLGWTARSEADPMLGTLVFEDLVIAFYLAIITAMILGDGTVVAALPNIGLAFGVILVLVLIMYLGTAVFERMLDINSVEQTIMRTIGVTVLIAGAALAMGVSEAVAAFFVGMAFSTTGHVEQIERYLEPIRDVFAAVFFFWIGLITNPLLFTTVAGLVLIAIVVTGGTKFISGYFSGQIYGLNRQRSVRVGCGMVTRGEFSLIIAALAAGGTGTVMTEILPAFAVAYVLVMGILGTTLMRHSEIVERLVIGIGSATPAAD